jgi:pSer/pThr/pTyr-binding forkhead associated (FHA) protein
MPKLLLRLDAALIREIALDKPTLSVGRKPDNDIVIESSAVSAHHCRIFLSGDAYFVEDLDSTNGTFINEKRVSKAALRHDDVIHLAKHALVFQADAAAPRPEAEPGEGSASPVELKSGGLRVLAGGQGESEYDLKAFSTYLGKSDRVQVKIKGSGLFGRAPEVAASIHRRREGYMLVAVKKGYPKVNGAAVPDQIPLKDGDIIECGATTLQFFSKDGA